ncbi:MAG: hypothetical protein ACFB0B_17505 [Thermonemataceae bacterium]
MFTLSCSVNKESLIGRYETTCYLHGEKELILLLKEDSTFEYRLAYLDEKIEGKWSLEDRNLILSSLYFNSEFLKKQYPEVPTELLPAHKYTDIEGKDIYKIRGNKLLIRNIDGIRKGCYLIKVR